MTAAGHNALVTSVMVCCGFIICWTPNEIVMLLTFLGGYDVAFHGWFYEFTVVLVITNSCINPFIYAIKYREFQQAVRRLKSKVNQQQSHVTTSA